MSIAKQRAAELKALAAQLLVVAESIETYSDGMLGAAIFDWETVTPEETIALAAKLLRDRRRRTQIGVDSMLGEPAWDILLTLYCETANGGRVLTKTACYGTGLPPTTALRYVNMLDEAGFIERTFSQDSRCRLLALSDGGRNKVYRYLAETLLFEQRGLADRNSLDFGLVVATTKLG